MAEIEAHDLVRAADPARGGDAAPEVGAGDAMRLLKAPESDPPLSPALPNAAVAQIDRPVPEQVAAETEARGPPDVTLRVKRRQRDVTKFKHGAILSDSAKISTRYNADSWPRFWCLAATPPP